jgi:ribonuclease Z
MKLIFLGTSAGSPSRTRNVSSTALQWLQSGSVWLFDCGEATQHRIQLAPIKLSHIEKIFISHVHGDHVFGLPGLMASRSAAQGVTSDLAIFGPAPLESLLRDMFAVTHTKIKYNWSFHGIEEGIIHEDETCVVVCRLLNHGIPSYGFSVVEKERPGEFNVALAESLGIPAGPIYGTLKSGIDVTLSDGRRIEASRFVGRPRKPRKVTICGDTGVSPTTAVLADRATVLVHESTFMADQIARAIEVGHSTAGQAAEAAKVAGVGTLILTHISPRYDQQEASLLPALLAEAKAIFPHTFVANDLMEVEIPVTSIENNIEP